MGLGFRVQGLGRASDADLQRVLSALPGFVSDVVGAVARVGDLGRGSGNERVEGAGVKRRVQGGGWRV